MNQRSRIFQCLWRRFRALVLGGTLILLASCAPTRDQRIAARADYFSTLPAVDQELVRAGRLRIGMPAPAVELALGKPTSRTELVGASGQVEEVWNYERFKPIYSSTNWRTIPVYDRTGRIRGFADTGPDILYLPYVAGRVVIRDGKVAAWSRAKSP